MDAFLKDQNEDPTVQDFNLKLNDMTKDFTELQITTEYQRAEFSNILSGALEDYISELEEAGVQVSEATLEKLNGQLVKAQNLIEIPAIKEQKEILKFKFKAIENPTDEQKAEYEAKLAELEKEYNERKSIIVAK